MGPSLRRASGRPKDEERLAKRVRMTETRTPDRSGPEGWGTVEPARGTGSKEQLGRDKVKSENLGEREKARERIRSFGQSHKEGGERD